MILEADGIEFSYDAKEKVLQSVYIKVAENEIVGLLGRNGSGKSTLLQVIFGSLSSETQSVRINGKKLVSQNKKLQQIAYLPQYNFVPENYTIETICNDYNCELIAFQNFIEKAIPKKQKFGLLSSGEQRLLELFITLHSSKKFVLLDEPFSYLSPKMINKISEEIIKQKSNKGIILTDHLYQNVINISDEIYFIQKGCTQKMNHLEDLKRLGYLR